MALTRQYNLSASGETLTLSLSDADTLVAMKDVADRSSDSVELPIGGMYPAPRDLAETQFQQTPVPGQHL